MRSPAIAPLGCRRAERRRPGQRQDVEVELAGFILPRPLAQRPRNVGNNKYAAKAAPTTNLNMSTPKGSAPSTTAYQGTIHQGTTRSLRRSRLKVYLRRRTKQEQNANNQALRSDMRNRTRALKPPALAPAACRAGADADRWLFGHAPSPIGKAIVANPLMRHPSLQRPSLQHPSLRHPRLQSARPSAGARRTWQHGRNA